MDTDPATSTPGMDAASHNSSSTSGPGTAGPGTAVGRNTEAAPGPTDDTSETRRARQPIRVLRGRAGSFAQAVGAARRSSLSTGQSGQRSTPTMARRGAAAVTVTVAAAAAGWLWRRCTTDRHRTRLQRAARLARRTAARVRARLPI